MKLLNIFDYLTQTDEQGNRVNSGASFNINTGDFNPKPGYFVALGSQYQAMYPIPKTPNQWQERVLHFLGKRTLDAIGGREDIYLGFWIHNDTLYMDLSERIMDRDEAIRQGHARDQIAIYDTENGQDIYMNKVSNDPDILTDIKH